MNIIIGFSKPRRSTILSKLIAKVEAREFSHAYVRFNCPLVNVPLVFQASGMSVNLVSANRFFKKSESVLEYILPINDAQLKLFWVFMGDNLGVSYSIKQLVQILWFKVSGKRGKANGSTGYICSELAANLLTYFKVAPIENLDYVTPSDLEKICAKHLERVS